MFNASSRVLFHRNGSNLKTMIISKMNKKLYSQVYDSIVKISDNIHNNELKIPVYNQTFSVYYRKQDKLADLNARIKGGDEKIEKIEFLDIDDKIIEDGNQVEDVLLNPFKIRINNHLLIQFFPSVNMIIKNADNHQTARHTILNNYNYYLYKIFANIKSEFKEYDIKNHRSEIENRLNYLQSIYEKKLQEYIKAEDILGKRCDSQRRRYINLGLAFFIAHAIVFYLLIYQFYGWDTIEPITYIVGNVYWIIALVFFTLKKKKLDLSLFYSDSFKKKFFQTYGRRLNYSEVEKNFIEKEIKEINQLKAALLKF